MECGVRETFVVAIGPLRSSFVALDGGSIDEAVLLDPLRCSAMILVVPYVLQRFAAISDDPSDTPWGWEKERYLYVEIMYMALEIINKQRMKRAATAAPGM